jgi:hypothetical protein
MPWASATASPCRAADEPLSQHQELAQYQDGQGSLHPNVGPNLGLNLGPSACPNLGPGVDFNVDFKVYAFRGRDSRP